MLLIFLLMFIACMLSTVGTYHYYKAECYRYSIQKAALSYSILEIFPQNNFGLIYSILSDFYKNTINLNNDWLLVCIEGIVLTFTMGVIGILIVVIQKLHMPWYEASTFFSLLSSLIWVIGTYIDSHTQGRKISNIVKKLYANVVFV